MITDTDLVQLNNILIAIKQTKVTQNEKNTYEDYTFNTLKDYFDLVRTILKDREVSPTIMNSFYAYSGSQGITYGKEKVKTDMLWVTSA